jgi:hypothetical protein
MLTVLESEPISVIKLPDGGEEKIFLPADASTASSPVITAHAFTYAPFDAQPASEQQDDEADAPKVKRHSRHATYVYDRLQVAFLLFTFHLFSRTNAFCFC